MAWSHDCMIDGDTDACGACKDEKLAYQNIRELEAARLEIIDLKSSLAIAKELLKTKDAQIAFLRSSIRR